MKKENVLGLQNALIGAGILATGSMLDANLGYFLTSLGISTVANTIRLSKPLLIQALFSNNDQPEYRTFLVEVIIGSLSEIFEEQNTDNDFLKRHRFYRRSRKLRQVLEQAPDEVYNVTDIQELTLSFDQLLNHGNLSAAELIYFGFDEEVAHAFATNYSTKIGRRFGIEITKDKNNRLWKEYSLMINEEIKKILSEKVSSDKSSFKKINEKLDQLLIKNGNNKRSQTGKLRLTNPNPRVAVLSNQINEIDEKLDRLLKTLSIHGAVEQGWPHEFQNKSTKSIHQQRWSLVIVLSVGFLLLTILLPIYQLPYNKTHLELQKEVIDHLKVMQGKFESYRFLTKKEERERMMSKIKNSYGNESNKVINLDKSNSPVDLSLEYYEYNDLFGKWHSDMHSGISVYGGQVAFLFDQLNEIITGRINREKIDSLMYNLNSRTSWKQLFNAKFSRETVIYYETSFMLYNDAELFLTILDNLIMAMKEQSGNYERHLAEGNWFKKTFFFRFLNSCKHSSPRLTSIRRSDVINSSNFLYRDANLVTKISQKRVQFIIMDPVNNQHLGVYKEDPNNSNLLIPKLHHDTLSSVDPFICIAVDTSYFPEDRNGGRHVAFSPSKQGPGICDRKNICRQIGIYFYLSNYFLRKDNHGRWVNTRKPSRNDLLNSDVYYSEYRIVNPIEYFF